MTTRRSRTSPPDKYSIPSSGERALAKYLQGPKQLNQSEDDDNRRHEEDGSTHDRRFDESSEGQVFCQIHR